MIVAMQDKATSEQIQNVIERMVELGFNVHRTTGETQTILAGVGTPAQFEDDGVPGALRRTPGVPDQLAVQTGRTRFPA